MQENPFHTRSIAAAERAFRLRTRADELADTPALAPLEVAVKRRAAELELESYLMDELAVLAPAVEYAEAA
ncbi:MAG: hypothetical protein HKN26_12730 [Acidimicrobiales bacterium]|nr:hypothetical protein [Acidimicrobiales bacterium]